MVCLRPAPVRHAHDALARHALGLALRGAKRAVLIATLVAAMRPALALDTDPALVDESPALSIGGFEVSRYILDKNYHQFVAAHRAKSGAQPSPQDIAAWFRLFVARQALSARLVEEGYVNRPEIRHTVDRMARQILTQVDGPFYRSLVPAGALAPARLRELHEISARVFDVVMVRFDDAATAARLLGPVASADAFEQAVRALAPSGRNAGFDFQLGPSTWPHGAFQEIADAIPAAAQGSVVGPITGKLGVYHLLVRGETRRPVPDFEVSRDQWANHVRRSYQHLAQRVRRQQILRECAFQADPVTVGRLAARLRPVKDQPHTIDETLTVAEPEETVATYTTPGGRRSITDRSFVRQFNQRMIRSLPRDPAALASAIADIVIEEADYAAALAARLDQEPRFVQDRRNFELKEALTLYEQEVLVPQLAISPEELQTYYTAQRERYAVTNEATGVIYHFPSPAAAGEGLSRLVRGEPVTGAERMLDPVLIRRDGPPLARERPNALFLTMPDGRPFGPFEHEGRPAIFVKRSSGPREAPPLSEIENVVRQDLLREKLDALVVTLLEAQPPARAFRVHFEFSQYGIDSPFEKTPEPAMAGSDQGSRPAPPPGSARSG